VSLALISGGRHAGRVINGRLRRENRELKADNQQLTQRADASATYVHEARIRACQDAMLIAQLRTERDEYATAVARMEERHDEEIRAHKRHVAELARRLELRSRTEAAVTRTQTIPAFFAATKVATTDPGHVPPSWAREDDTVPVPVITPVEPAH